VKRLTSLAVLVIALLGVDVGVACARPASVRTVVVPLRTVTAPHVVRARAQAQWRTLAPRRVGRRFAMVGLHWRGAPTALFAVRTRTLGGPYGAWAAVDVADLPRADERRPRAPWQSEPLWVGAADVVQVRVLGDVGRLYAVAVDPGADPSLTRRRIAAAPPGEPEIIARADWGADEKIRRAAPSYAPRVTVGFVHHTATPNGYGATQAAAIVRSIYLYHVRGNGWNDIGYNFLVDTAGRVYEGRYGGVGRNVVGAHTGGFNSGTFAIALIGDFSKSPPPAAQLAAVEQLLAWRLDVAHADPSGRSTLVSAGNERYTKGKAVAFATISAHRDAGLTDCPGDALYALLPQIRTAVAAVGGLHVWEPTLAPATIRPTATGIEPIRFRARLSKATAWKVTVSTTAGVTVATRAGNGATVDATWDGTVEGGGPLPKADTLRWSIDAGAGGGAARAATGTFNGSGSPAGTDGAGTTVTDGVADVKTTAAVMTPDGDGSQDVSTLTWTQVKAGQVRVAITRPTGEEVALVQDVTALVPGPQTLSWDGLATGGIAAPSGAYRWRVQVQPDGAATAATAAVPFSLRHQAGGLVVTPVISPNGDGIADAASIDLTRYERGGATIQLLHGTTIMARIATLDDQAPGPFHYLWAASAVADGAYVLQVLAPGAGGRIDLRAPLRIDTAAPKVAAGRVARTPHGDLIASLRVSEPGTLAVRVAGKVVRTVTARRAGRVIVRVPRSDIGVAHSLTIVALDAVGNGSRKPVRIVVPPR
jgi:hypothetical protein